MSGGAALKAILEGNVKEVASLLRRRPLKFFRRQLDPNALIVGQLPLHEAVQACHVRIVDLLLQNGADVTARGGTRGWSALHAAAKWDRSEGAPIVRILLSHGADANSRDDEGTTPLHWATTADAALALIGAGARTNQKEENGQTPLHWAAQRDSRESRALVHCLVRAGADIEAKDNKGQTPLHQAAWFGTTSRALKALLECGAEIHARDGQGMTPLHVAARKCTINCIVELLKAGEDPNVRDDSGGTPLHALAKSLEDSHRGGQPGCAWELLEHGADPDLVDKAGNGPFSFGHMPISVTERRAAELIEAVTRYREEKGS